jgi:hypothetical protein
MSITKYGHWPGEMEQAYLGQYSWRLIHSLVVCMLLVMKSVPFIASDT